MYKSSTEATYSQNMRKVLRSLKVKVKVKRSPYNRPMKE